MLCELWMQLLFAELWSLCLRLPSCGFVPVVAELWFVLLWSPSCGCSFVNWVLLFVVRAAICF